MLKNQLKKEGDETVTLSRFEDVDIRWEDTSSSSHISDISRYLLFLQDAGWSSLADSKWKEQVP